MICLSLSGRTLSDNLATLRRYDDQIDLAELRVDLLRADERQQLSGFPSIAKSALGRNLPLICTIRLPADGGAFDGTEEERQALFTLAIDSGYDYVDLEAPLRGRDIDHTLAARAAKAGCTVIRSYHEAGGVPADPRAVLEDLDRVGSEIPMLAVVPRRTADLTRLLQAADECAGIRKIIRAAGPYGAPVTILSRRFGSLMSFVSCPDSSGVAPGHAGPQEMKSLYRIHNIDRKTRFFAVIGNPIAHSQSPRYHNGRFREANLDACYVPVLVDEVPAFFKLAEGLPLDGFSVTLPYKEAVLPFLAETDDAVRVVGSCNTVLRAGDTWRGINTDVQGFSAPLAAALSHSGAIGAGQTGAQPGATVIGAGGAARAVVYALLELGLKVKVINRSEARAKQLVADFAGRPVNYAALGPETDLSNYRDVIVQTTNVGMNGRGDPVPWLEFDGGEILYDIVYTPPETPLVRRAREAGCKVLTGDLMFEAQADAQYQLFQAMVSA